jgi:hypothetical protein
VLEAIAGLPVVASDVGNVAEARWTVRPASVRPDDPAAFARAVGRLLADVDLRRRLGKAGRARALARFTFGDAESTARSTTASSAAPGPTGGATMTGRGPAPVRAGRTFRPRPAPGSP